MPAKKKNTVKEWFDTLFYGGLIAIVFRSFLLEPFNIPSGSMIPSLHVGDHIFVQKWAYGYSRFSFPFGSWGSSKGRFWAAHEPQRGDIIVFRNDKANVDYVKRLIGLPGDTIQMKKGILYINSEPVERKDERRYIIANLKKSIRSVGYHKDDISIQGNKLFVDNKPADFNYTITYDCEYNPQERCGVFELKEYTEVLPNGVEHSIIEVSDNEEKDNTELFIVPENHYFFMGDNRDNSQDSRFEQLGYVPRANVIGRSWFIWYSHNYYSPMLAIWNWGNKMRWERFGIGKTKLGMTKAK